MTDDRDGDGDRQQGDYNRPRRPNPDTVSYLRSLPLDVEAANDEVTTFLRGTEQPSDYPQSLSAALSAIDEIRNEMASLAGDEYGSQCIEVMAAIALPYSEFAARTMLHGLSGYHLHLATHRYGSHVVQSVLQLAMVSKSDQDLAVHEDGPQLTKEDIPSLFDLILAMVDELLPHANQLAVHVCGSHVLRSLLCLLGGVNLQQGITGSENKLEGGALRRGKNKNKKKKKKPDAAQSQEHSHAGIMQMTFKSNTRIESSSLLVSLTQLSDALWGVDLRAPGELQQMACHPSASPLLIVSLRVLTYAFVSSRKEYLNHESDQNQSISNFRLGIQKTEPIYQLDSPASRLACSILCLNLGNTNEKQVGDIIYGLSGEPRGSLVLETLFRTSPDVIYEKIMHCGSFVTSMKEYCEHTVSNFVIQALFTTVRTKEQGEALLKSVEKVVINGYVVDKRNRRRGIIWRAAEMAAKFQVGQESLLESIRIGLGTATSQTNNEGIKDNKVDEGATRIQKHLKTSPLPLCEYIPLLLDVKVSDREGGRVTLDAEGVRAIYHLLRFSPRLCGEVLDGIILNISKEDLELIAKDGLGSRCVMDGILDGPMNEPVFAMAAKNLMQKLSGRWVALASDRVGHHSVKKLFKALLDVEDKAEMASELANGSNRLGGSSMGRSVMQTCAIEKFLEGEQPWKDTIKKMQQKDEWLKEMIEVESDDIEMKKRKHNRKKGDRDNEKGVKVSRTSNSAVALIMATISRTPS